MNPAPPDLIDKLLMTRGASETYTLLQSFGYTTTRPTLETRVSQMIAQGIRKPLVSKIAQQNTNVGPRPPSAEEGCKGHRELLMRYYANREKGIAA